MRLDKDGIARRGRVNRVVDHDLGNDSFKERGVWIELELADGRKCSSKVHTPVYTQPPSWLYAEGEGVPLGQNITVDIVFDVRE